MTRFPKEAVVVIDKVNLQSVLYLNRNADEVRHLMIEKFTERGTNWPISRASNYVDEWYQIVQIDEIFG